MLKYPPCRMDACMERLATCMETLACEVHDVSEVKQRPTKA